MKNGTTKRKSFNTNKTETRWRMVKCKKQILNCCTLLSFTVFFGMGLSNYSYAGPTGGTVTSGVGSGTIVQQGDVGYDGTNTNISQTAQRLDINWDTFSTAVNESVNFTQPNAGSVAINRVIGGVPSQLRGALNANGRVFVLNDSGITFYGTSQVNVGSLVATTAANVSENNGTYTFSDFGDASVINDGSIVVSNGGFAVLAAPYVENNGYIQANLGRIGLTSTTNLDVRGDGLITYEVSEETLAKIGVKNTGELQAHSGVITLSANIASDIATSVINLDGIVDADSFDTGYEGGSLLVASVDDVVFGDGFSVKADRGVTVEAGNSVAFENKDDSISTTSGDIRITAGAGGIDVGSLETAGSEYPGDIRLETTDGGDIKTASLSVSGSAIDDDDVDIEGYISVDSDGDIIVDGDITINVSAESTSESSATASATADIYAAGSIDVTGNVSISAKAKVDSSDDDGYYTEAYAELNMYAGYDGSDYGYYESDVINSEEGGDLTVTGDITVTADADSIGGTDTASAMADVTLYAADNVNIIGDITVTADTDFEGTESYAESEAYLYVEADQGDIDITGDINVSASATKTGSDSSATAEASAEFYAGQNINVTGDVTVSATSLLDMASDEYGYYSEADAELYMSAGESEEGGDLTVTGDITVTADADSIGGTDTASADASAYLYGDNVTVTGDVSVTADANLAGSDDGAEADVYLYVEADEGDIDITGDINVSASATKTGSYSSATAEASAEFYAGQNINVTGDVTVSATSLLDMASDEYGYYSEADAELYMSAGESEEGGDLTVTGDITVTADADSIGGTDTASATADVTLYAADNVNITGDITVTADTDFEGTESYAESEADLYVEANNGDIDITGDINVSASATKTGSDSSATAEASAEFYAGQNINVTGDVTVSATSLLDMASDEYGYYSEADAELYMSAGESEEGGDLTITGDITVTADADSIGGTDTASADASAYLYGDNVTVTGDIAVTADANLAGSDDDAEADAYLYVEADDGDIDVTGSLDVTAKATNNAEDYYSGDAEADAEIYLYANDVNVTGTINVSAEAITSNSTDYDMDAEAYATLDVEADGSIDIGDDITVTATADQSETSSASYGTADAEVDLYAYGDITTKGIKVSALVDQRTEYNADYARTDANLDVYSDEGSIGVDGDVLVEATTYMDGYYLDAPHTNASASFESNEDGDVTITGDIAVKGKTVLNAEADVSYNNNDDYDSYYYYGYDEDYDENDGSGYTTASLEIYSGGDVDVTGDIDVTAETEINAEGDVSYNNEDYDSYYYYSSDEDYDENDGLGYTTALLEIYSEGDVDVTGDIDVTAETEINVAGNVNYGGSSSYYNDSYDSSSSYYDEGDDDYEENYAFTTALLDVVSSNGDVDVTGDISVDATSTINHTSSSDYDNGPEYDSEYYDGDLVNALAFASIVSDNNVNIEGDISVDATSNRNYLSEEGNGYYYQYEDGYYYSPRAQIPYDTALSGLFIVANGDLNVTGDTLVTAASNINYTSFDGPVAYYYDDEEETYYYYDSRGFEYNNRAETFAVLAAGNDLNITGDISSIATSSLVYPRYENEGSSPVPTSQEKDGSDYYNNNSFLGLYAENNITITAYNEPKSQANDALVQQLFSGEDYVDGNEAVLEIEAGGEVTFLEPPEPEEPQGPQGDDEVPIVISQTPAPSLQGGDDGDDDTPTPQDLENIAPAAGGDDDDKPECTEMNCGDNA